MNYFSSVASFPAKRPNNAWIASALEPSRNRFASPAPSEPAPPRLPPPPRLPLPPRRKGRLTASVFTFWESSIRANRASYFTCASSSERVSAASISISRACASLACSSDR
ncbi:MAG TPA: hypothetical protein EYN03_01015 [Planctomycetes bacterium]|nr:hypothetical protein [Planctomycetota bacterium]